MPFGRKARTVRAYEYGCLAPTEGEARAIEEMYKRVRLWNQLVELDQRYDGQREAIIAPFVTSAGDKERKAQRRAAFKREDVKATLQALDKEEYEEARVLWLASQLYWVNHEEVKLAWQQARRRPGKLRFHSFRCEPGKLSVRWQTGLATREAFGANSLLRLAPVPPEAYTVSMRGERRRLARSTVSIRVASQDRQPVWLILPCVLHRPLPDGLIRSASVLRERVGRQYRWKLILIVETALTPAIPAGKADASISIKLCWTQTFEGLEVARWVDSEGQSGVILLPSDWLEQKRKVDDIKAIRRHHFNNILMALKGWLAGREIPEWLQEETRGIGQWKSEGRLHRLLRVWSANRFAGDEEAYEVQLQEWHKRDIHLGDYQMHLDDQLLRRRREIYRIAAARIAERYGRVSLDDMDLSQLARRAKVGEKGYMPEAIRHNRYLAAPSQLRLAIRNACQRNGIEVAGLRDKKQGESSGNS